VFQAKEEFQIILTRILVSVCERIQYCTVPAGELNILVLPLQLLQPHCVHRLPVQDLIAVIQQLGASPPAQARLRLPYKIQRYSCHPAAGSLATSSGLALAFSRYRVFLITVIQSLLCISCKKHTPIQLPFY
jgi:hypothetical protein